MGISSSQLQPQEIVAFKKLPTNIPLDNIEIPEIPENRKRTNFKWLIVMIIFMGVLLPFLIYTLCYSDIRRIMSGYDKCGNICGSKNYHWDGIDCSGEDMTDKPYIQYNEGGDSDLADRYCVRTCQSGYVPFLGRCVKGSKQGFDLSNNDPNADVQIHQDSIDIGMYLDDVKWQIIISCLLSVLVAMGMLFLFRYAVAFVVWGIMIGSFFGLLILVGVFWYLYIYINNNPTNKQGDESAALVVAITFTILAVVLGIVLIWCRKKIQLVILLLKETIKAIFTMPGLMSVPVICLCAIGLLTVLFGFTTFFMSSSGVLEHLVSDYYVYNQNVGMTISMVLNFIVYLWLTQFFTGIQYMVIAGAVSKWYFSRDKNFLGSPILTSAANAFKFHLGTVALGSLIITIIAVIKAIILGLIKNEKIKIFVRSIVESIETFLKFLSKNAYIITALHGQPFIRSGKRAAKLIMQNISDIIAINYIGDFVLGMAKLLIVVVSVLLSMAVFAIAPGQMASYGNLIGYIIVGVVALVVACVAFAVFETTIDTIFICYCEDSILNDGMARPYFMSRNLMEFVQDSKQVYAKN